MGKFLVITSDMHVSFIFDNKEELLNFFPLMIPSYEHNLENLNKIKDSKDPDHQEIIKKVKSFNAHQSEAGYYKTLAESLNGDHLFKRTSFMPFFYIFEVDEITPETDPKDIKNALITYNQLDSNMLGHSVNKFLRSYYKENGNKVILSMVEEPDVFHIERDEDEDDNFSRDFFSLPLMIFSNKEGAGALFNSDINKNHGIPLNYSYDLTSEDLLECRDNIKIPVNILPDSVFDQTKEEVVKKKSSQKSEDDFEIDSIADFMSFMSGEYRNPRYYSLVKSHHVFDIFKDNPKFQELSSYLKEDITSDDIYDLF